MEDEIDSKVAASLSAVTDEKSGEEEESAVVQNILLFYKFHPLSNDWETVELYRQALENLCRCLGLHGRILVGCNEHQSEGINGTLSGSTDGTKAFVHAMTHHASFEDTKQPQQDKSQDALQVFWGKCQQFYDAAKCEPLVMRESDFKWSTCSKSQLFPDLNIKCVKELIGTGGVLASIPLDEVHKGYLTPEEWHERMARLQEDKKARDDTVLIDCRNTKEWQIGHFPGAPDPATTTFNQFPTWVQQNSQNLANKKVLMYCTGGIRCEKASAFIRSKVPSVQEVRHLQGGIHKYLDKFGEDPDKCLWKGKNFVFDGRGAHATASKKDEVVGKCLYCTSPYDTFQPGCVCTVCREPTLVCFDCRPNIREYHCQNHLHMRECYFTDLSPYSKNELENQLNGLRELITEIAVGKKFKQRRKTLSKQCNKVTAHISALENGDANPTPYVEGESKCRNCGDVGCSGSCWGFHGLKRKRILDAKEDRANQTGDREAKNAKVDGVQYQSKGNNVNLQQRKVQLRKSAIDELIQLKLASTPAVGRDEATGIRIPVPCTRELNTRVKGKWCKETLFSILQNEFPELAETDTLKKMFEGGLMRVNNKTITSVEEAKACILKNMDTFSRIMHWHEPPIRLPDATIPIHRQELPLKVQEEFGLTENGVLFVCSKPSSVPVHPAGPYLSNSLTTMVEAQEGLPPKSLIPCHRIDRVTSGLTLCCTNPKIAHLVQQSMESGCISKYYLAMVHGRFPSCKSEFQVDKVTTDVAKWNYSEEEKVLEVDAPIETIDPANGIRKITAAGKSSRSLFRFISYDLESDKSLILCSPLTGRSHQLRLHLQWLGHSIVNDVQYGGTFDRDMDLQTGLRRTHQFQLTQKHTAPLTLEYITSQQSEAAAKICRFCTEGPQKAFSPAQLLEGGHEICLHAARYQIAFLSKQKNSKTCVGKMDLRVKLPPWMPTRVDDLIDKLPFDVPAYEGDDPNNGEACSIQ